MKHMKYCPTCRSQLNAEASPEGPDRLKCSNSACPFVFWNNPTPVVAAIIQLEEKVLLVKHVDWPPKMLGLVSGFLESNEHPDEAIRREIMEETQLETERLSFIGHYAFTQQNQLILAYEAQCRGTVVLNEELDRYKLLEPAKLVPWQFGTGPAVKDWLARRKV